MKAENMVDVASIRGEMIVNNAKLASVEGQIGVHDSHVLFGKVEGKNRLIVLYRGQGAYYLNIIDPNTSATVESLLVGKATGWAPRMYNKDGETIRIMYTKEMTAVYYRDFDMSTLTLGQEAAFKVAIKKNGGAYDAPVAFTLDRFLEHCANVTGIDYRSSDYDLFASRHLLVEDTQQLQVVDGRYYLTAEVLSDRMPDGDCGGIACLIWSEDLDVWYLNDPIRLVENLSDQRDHEVSATYLNGEWHALSRYNKCTFGAPTGFRYYTSVDGDQWTFHGLSTIPRSHGGIRHAIHRMNLFDAAPSGTTANKSEKEVAFILYQKIPDIYAYHEYDDSSHRLRTLLSLVYTTDFVTFHPVADIRDRGQLHYPSMTMYQDRLYMTWSSAIAGDNFVSSIQWSHYNLSSITCLP